MGDAIKYLYKNFILRDVLSFITPGAIIVLIAFLILMPEQSLSQRLDTLFKYSRDMHWLLYIPLFGIFYFVGYATQCVFLFRCNWGKKDEAMKQERETTIDFLNATANAEWATQHWERTVVHKQMCLNNLGAGVIAVIFLLVDRFKPWQSGIILVISIIVLLFLVFVWCDYRDSKRAQGTIENKIIALSNDAKLREDK